MNYGMLGLTLLALIGVIAAWGSGQDRVFLWGFLATLALVSAIESKWRNDQIDNFEERVSKLENKDSVTQT
jgi:hypothetical protein